MQFGDKLASLRKKQGMSQEQLADRLGVTRQSVSKWESGSSMPELSKLISISDLYSVSVDYLVRDAIDDPQTPRQETAGRPERTDATGCGYVYVDSPFRVYEYVSKTRIAGVPLICVRFGGARNVTACGIIAVGNIAIGLISVGGIAFGALSLGGVAFGLAAFGGVAMGFVAFGATAIGYIAGGISAIGYYAAGFARVARRDLSKLTLHGLLFH